MTREIPRAGPTALAGTAGRSLPGRPKCAEVIGRRHPVDGPSGEAGVVFADVDPASARGLYAKRFAAETYGDAVE